MGVSTPILYIDKICHYERTYITSPWLFMKISSSPDMLIADDDTVD